MFKERLNPQTNVKFMTSMIPVVHIHDTALEKMQVYVQEAPGSDEIGWLGTVLREENDIYITDVYLFKQQVHGTTTEITPEGLSEFGMELLSQPDGMEIWNNMKMWGHSHVNMGVTPSGQDDKQMKEFAQIGHDFFIRLIANKKGEMKIDVYDYANGFEFHDVPWFKYATSDVYKEAEETIANLEAQIEQIQAAMEEHQEGRIKELAEPIKAEIKEKVSKLSYSYGYTRPKGQVGYTVAPSVQSTQQLKPGGKFDLIDGVKQSVHDVFTTWELNNMATYCHTYGDLLEELDQMSFLEQMTYSDVQKVWKEVQNRSDYYDEILDYNAGYGYGYGGYGR